MNNTDSLLAGRRFTVRLPDGTERTDRTLWEATSNLIGETADTSHLAATAMALAAHEFNAMLTDLYVVGTSPEWDNRDYVIGFGERIAFRTQ